MKASEYRKLDNDELEKQQNTIVKELFNLKFQMHTGRLENTSKIKNLRRDIARVKTILSQNVAERG
jgi:large subunit ribosomal protein L29